MKNIVIFASGSGSNAEKIILHFKDNSQGNVVRVFSNNQHAKVLDISKKYNIPTVVFNKTELSDGTVFNIVNEIKPDLIVLAGFLLKFPDDLILHYPNKIINIHPALLPKYGGKGMYGMNVHRAILENNDTETGISIHYVNEHYDEGGIIFQQSVNIQDCKTPEEIAEKVHQLEHQHFSEVIEKLINTPS